MEEREKERMKRVEQEGARLQRGGKEKMKRRGKIDRKGEQRKEQEWGKEKK